MKSETFLENLRTSLIDIFGSYPNAVLLGEDVLDPYGGAFKVSKGLSTLFPDRVFSTPISEASIVGCGVGLALRGYRPLVEIMFGDFITLTVDQLVNHAAKFGLMYKHNVKVPLVVRTPMGGGRGYGPTHSQSLEKLLLGIPNLAVVAPSLFHIPGEELKAAFLDDRPVLFIENKQLYPRMLFQGVPGMKLTRCTSGRYNIAHVANFADEAPADAVLISYGGVSCLVEEILHSMAEEEIRINALFVAELSGSTQDVLYDVVAGCGRVVLIEEGSGGFGWAAQVASDLYGRLFRHLKAPIGVVAAGKGVIPANLKAEREMLVNKDKIEDAVMEVLK